MLLENFLRYFKDPTDVYTAIHPLFCVCTFFGLAPYSLRLVENGKKCFKFSWWPLLRNALLAILLMASMIYHILYNAPPFSDTDSKQKLKYFLEIFSSLLSSCAVIFGLVFALKIIEVFKNIEEVDVAFRSLAVWVPYKKLYVSIMAHLVLLFLIVTVVTVTIFLFAPNFYFSGPWSIYFLSMTTVLPYFINLLMDLQYCHYLNILRVRYKLLNEYLETLVQDNQEGWTSEVKTVATKKEVFGSGGKLPKSVMAISDPVFVVDQVAALHIKLTDTAHMINYAFCFQQLLRITVAFISIVTALFFIAVTFSKSSPQKSDEKPDLDYFFTYWAFSNACEVMAIVWITSETCEEANTCPRILHKIRNNTTNVNLQETIEIYSLQMYHNRLYFTVCGLFPLDYTLLYTIVAGVTTYLVILIQFNSDDFAKAALNATSAPPEELLNITDSS